MTTYSTQNPLGSSDPRDLYDNSQAFDEAVNSEGTTFNDRLGKSRLTLKGMEQVFDGGQPAIDAFYNATAQADRAESEADRSEAARDAAFVNADVYADIASGLAAVADGEQFQVAQGNLIIRYRRDSASSATEVARYPSHQLAYESYVKALAYDADEDYISIDSDNASMQLIGSEETAVAFSAKAKREGDQVTIKSESGEIVFQGSLDSIATGMRVAKMVVDKDGLVKWSPHNLAIKTDDLTYFSSASVELGPQELSHTGKYSAFKFESKVDNSIARFYFDLSVIPRGRWYRTRAIVRAGNLGNMYFMVENDGNKLAYFDIRNGVVGTVSSGIEATIENKDENGNLLPEGFYLVDVRWINVESSPRVYIGLTDTDGSISSISNGDHIYIEEPSISYGYKKTPYYENPLTTSKNAVAFDWTQGEKLVYLSPSVKTFSLHSDDLTQPEWVKSGATATFDQIGPHGEACSRLSADLADATCIQTISDTSASGSSFSAFVRPNEGHGVIEVTVDGGTTWKNVTSDVEAGKYSRVWLAGPTSGIGVGFRLKNAGDWMDVAIATAVDSLKFSPPLPVMGLGASTGEDELILDFSPFFVDAFAVSTSQFSLRRYAKSPHQSLQDIARIEDGTNSYSLGLQSSSKRINAEIRGSDSSFASGNVMHDDGDLQSIDAAIRVAPDKSLVSVNGESPLYLGPSAGFQAGKIRFTAGNSLWIDRFVSVPRTIADEDLSNWKRHVPFDGLVRASSVVSYFSGVENTTLNREPSVTVLHDDGEYADIMLVWMQRHVTGHHVEAPARLMQRNYRYNKVSNRLTPLTDASVLYEHDTWSDGEGHNQSASSFVVPDGPLKGRVVLLFTKLSGATFATDRDVYVTVNDFSGEPGAWTVPQLVVSSSSLGKSLLAMMADGNFVILPPSHPVASNRVVGVVWDNNHEKYSIYSDNYGGPDGTDWALGSFVTNGDGLKSNETNLSPLPDGRIIATHRLSDAPAYDNRKYSLSDDGGVTFVEQDLIPNWKGAACSASLVQLDKTGVTGPIGKLAMSRPLNNEYHDRAGILVDFADDATFEFAGGIYPWSYARYMGYSSMKALFGGSHIAIAAEGGTDSYNVDESCYLSIIKVPEFS